MISLRNWRIDSHAEPMVRIGIVLDEDAANSVAIDNAGTGRVTARLAEGQLDWRLNDEPWQRAPRVTLAPTGAAGMIVRNVIAGRGFHWQKPVDQTLTGRIEVLPGTRGLIVVNELPLESYLASVITSEMSSACPIEFLRAQCITARSWLLACTEPKHEREPFDRCNDDCCQRYQGTEDLSDIANEAVESTRGLVLVARDYERDRDVVVDANYSKSCGGIVELPEFVWGVKKPGLGPAIDAPERWVGERFFPLEENQLYQYLDGMWLEVTDVYCGPRVVPEAELGKYLGRVDVSGSYFRWTVRYAHDQLIQLLRQKLRETADIARLHNLRVLRRGVSGRATEIVLDVERANGARDSIIIADQYRIRQVLHKSFLYSSAFEVRIDRDASGNIDALTLRGAGWGHGAGLCQIGALGMSLRGFDHAQIVKHYFPDAELRHLY